MELKKRVSLAFVVVATLVLPLAATTTASPVHPSPTSTVTRPHKVHQLLIPTKMGSHPANVVRSAGVYGYTNGAPPLVYQTGAPVQVSAKEYVIWWNPGHLQNGASTSYGSAAYQSVLPRFIKDLSGSGFDANVTQYFQGSTTKTFIKNTVSYGGAFTDTTAFPAGHCSNGVTGSNCITDADIIAAVHRAQSAHNISGSNSSMIAVFTPAGEGSCFDSGCTQGGSYTNYCAYHGYTNAVVGSGNITYANMPWGDPNYCSDPSVGQTFPNDASNHATDANVNVYSHELIEARTDPLLNAWYDSSGYEIGDECAWEFGTENWPSGGNLEMNGHPYDTQPEASNHANGCVLAGP